MRNITIAPGEHYHIYNRGAKKSVLFHDTGDYYRFLFLVIYFQSIDPIPHIGRKVKEFIEQLGQHSVLANEEQDVNRSRCIVDLIAFCIMPNHFHLIIKEVDDGGISVYMQRVLNAYAKYYNTKYEKSGHVFQGPFQAVHVADDRQLLYLSAYIHKNSSEITKWRKSWTEYPWSSYQDFVGDNNRWGKFIDPEIILGQFTNPKAYAKFVNESTAKEAKEKEVSISG